MTFESVADYHSRLRRPDPLAPGRADQPQGAAEEASESETDSEA
jgi:hypothetical protein